MPSLDELARAGAVDAEARVPAWTLGCFLRRSIVYATGCDDTLTKVVWVQSHTMTGDLRIPPNRPHIAAGDRPEDMDLATLTALAGAEGSVGETYWNDGIMSWQWGPSVQPYDKWSEPALLRRVGTSLIEFAPSGIYVEDWRHQPSAPGAIGALRLVGESDEYGRVWPRSGAMVFAGDHVIQCLDARARPLPQGLRAQDLLAASADPVAAYRWIVACATDYAVGGTIVASTDPWREGLAIDLAHFARDGRTLRQSFVRGDRVLQRFWQIVSLDWCDDFAVATTAEPDKLRWLDRESDTLLAAHRMASCAS